MHKNHQKQQYTRPYSTKKPLPKQRLFILRHQIAEIDNKIVFIVTAFGIAGIGITGITAGITIRAR